MEIKTLQEITADAREVYVRALKNCSRPEVDIAIEGMKQVVKMEPAFKVARDKLRELERRKAREMGAFSKMLASIGGAFKAGKVRALARKNPVEALAVAEDALASYVYIPAVLNAMADVGEDLEAPFITVDALSLIREISPKNEANLRKLAKAYQANNQAREGLKVFQEVAAKYPNNLQVQAELRAALALASMERGKWEEEGKTQEKALSAQNTVAEQISEGTIHGGEQAKQVIKLLTEELKTNDSIDLRRRLGDAYMAAERYDDAIVEFNKIAEKLGAMDPLLDKNIEKAKCAKYDLEIASAMDAETKNKLIAERDAYRLERAEDRVQKYPNDALLRYELALLYFDKNDVEEALEQFQHARKSPQKRLSSMVYLGRCFAAKNQYDLAEEQFQSAIKDMIRMDKDKMEALYYLGETYDRAGSPEKAIECYKEIYQNQANFRDVAQKIEEYYNKNNNKQ